MTSPGHRCHVNLFPKSHTTVKSLASHSRLIHTITPAEHHLPRHLETPLSNAIYNPPRARLITHCRCPKSRLLAFLILYRIQSTAATFQNPPSSFVIFHCAVRPQCLFRLAVFSLPLSVSLFAISCMCVYIHVNSVEEEGKQPWKMRGPEIWGRKSTDRRWCRVAVRFRSRKRKVYRTCGERDREGAREFLFHWRIIAREWRRETRKRKGRGIPILGYVWCDGRRERFVGQTDLSRFDHACLRTYIVKIYISARYFGVHWSWIRARIYPT